MSSFPFLTSLLSLCSKMFRRSVLHVGEVGMILLIDFRLNMVFTNGKCMLFPKCCPRVSLGFLPWKRLFPPRQDIPRVGRRSCANFPLGFFPLLVLAAYRRMLEYDCEILVVSWHCVLCFCGVVANVLLQWQKKGAADHQFWSGLQPCFCAPWRARVFILDTVVILFP